MMSQEETQEQTGSTYGRYAGDETYAHLRDEAPYEHMMRETLRAKVYPETHTQQNVFRLIGLAISLASLLAFAVVCLVLVGGIGGWISFCAACLATFIVATVAIDHIK
ncbi:hypothetical protein EPA93_06425 [Ktedonosporobacter rubrisoli]|uniref:Uncharacterized protein n=1 Tax=Ktedonosporobacter rubrisoli TaxID=2509675 RepID=A0A4P6JKG6_KTERU|nr:hypothetical protein [Ktedonosporobacter rubrisoli]QBD75658.1 hypothetical protein EPA93_06425 [Ktedonosporobacter rubrisoli]